MISERPTIPWARPVFGDKEKEYLAKALDSSWISGGPYVEKFEKDFLSQNEASFGLSASNGTTALYLALLAAGVGEGDEVIVPGFTFVAPYNMVLTLRAKPVYADIDPDTWCIDPKSIEKNISARTKAILPVHIYGNVSDMDEIIGIAQKHHLSVVEDTAEAAFSKYRDRFAGTMGNFGCFSFQATKTITMGEGGFVIAANEGDARKMKVLREHGMTEGKRYWHDVVGFNFRLTNLQAAVGCGQLEHLPFLIKERERVYKLYQRELEKVSGLTMQRFSRDVTPVVWAIAVKLNPKAFRHNRNEIIGILKSKGIETRPGFYPACALPLYNANTKDLPNSHDVGANVVSLPSFPVLTEEEITYICKTLASLKR